PRLLFPSRGRHTRLHGVQTCALPGYGGTLGPRFSSRTSSCQSSVEYAFVAKSGVQVTPRSTYGLRSAVRAFRHLSKAATMRPDEIIAERSCDANMPRNDCLDPPARTFLPAYEGPSTEPYNSANSLF